MPRNYYAAQNVHLRTCTSGRIKRDSPFERCKLSKLSLVVVSYKSLLAKFSHMRMMRRDIYFGNVSRARLQMFVPLIENEHERNFQQFRSTHNDSLSSRNDAIFEISVPTRVQIKITQRSIRACDDDSFPSGWKLLFFRVNISSPCVFAFVCPTRHFQHDR